MPVVTVKCLAKHAAVLVRDMITQPADHLLRMMLGGSEALCNAPLS